jgi:hypothetical protein
MIRDLRAIDLGTIVESSAGATGAGDDPVALALVGAGTFAVIVVIVVIAVVVVKARQRRQGSAWGVTAQRLGLALEPWDPRFLSDFDRMRARAGGAVPAPQEPVTSQGMRGAFRGVPVTVSVARHQGRDALTGATTDSYTTSCRAYFATPLGIGLTVAERGWIAPLLSTITGTQSIPTGHPALDRAFGVVAANPGRARALIAPLADDILRVATAPHRVTIADAFVSIELDGLVTEAPRIAASLEAAAFLAQRITATNGSLGH